MAHAICLDEVKLGWNFIRSFRREADGHLSYIET